MVGLEIRLMLEVTGGRCRWKIENETFNTLKNQGYHIEHNYGHGEKNLSMNFFLLNLLAFFMHQIFELTDDLYQQCRKKLGSRREFWNCLRGVLKVLIFPDWETLLQRVLTPSKFWWITLCFIRSYIFKYLKKTDRDCSHNGFHRYLLFNPIKFCPE